MKWDSKSEIRLKTFVTYDLCRGQQAGPYSLKKPDAIMFASGMDQLKVLMCGGKKKSRNQTVLDDFDHFYYLTNDAYGEAVLRLICVLELREYLDSVLMQGLTPAPGGSGGIDCDAIDENGAPVLFGYTCDMPRIKRFVSGLARRELKGVLYCFDFQGEVIRQICSSQINIQCIVFETVKSLLWENE